MKELKHLMHYQGQTVALTTVRIELPNGESRVVSVEDLEPVEHLRDLGPSTAGEQWVRLDIQKGKGIGIEANGVWPEDLPRLLRQALVMVETQNAMDKGNGGKMQ